MTSEAFRDALAKGQGRTALVLQTEDPAPFADAILAACVENLQWDRQLEENRALYVMRLVDLAGIGEGALDAILTALRDGKDSEDGWDRDWMVDLLEEFARRGEASAWEALRELAEAGHDRAQSNLATANEAGLEWVAANILPNLPEDDLYRIVFWLPDEQTDDATPLQRRLRALKKENDARRDAVREARVETKPTARRFLRSLDDPEAPYASPYEFARAANASEWREAAERLLRETDPRIAWRLALIYRRREFPFPPRRLFLHAAHQDRGAAVCRVLSGIDAPSVRHFARKLMRKRPLPWGAIGALEASFRPGDEALIAEVLPDVEAYRRGRLHGIVGDMVDFLRKYPQGAWQGHAEWIYEHSPCSVCRASAVRWMAEHGVLPDTIREEGAHDAEPDVREAVATRV